MHCDGHFRLAVGNTLLMTSAASAGVGPGTGLFIADGGSLRVQVGKRPGDADLYSDMLIVDRTQVGAGGHGRARVGPPPGPTNAGDLSRPQRRRAC